MRIEIWSDIVCPWCYIGRARLQKALDAFEHRDEVQLVYKAFELDPSAPTDRTELTRDVLGRRYGGGEAQIRAMFSQVEQAGAQDGLDLRLEETHSGNTRHAHRMVKLAAQSDRAGAMLEHLYKAYFTDGRNVFTTEDLVELATEVGLDAAEARQTLESGAFEAEIQGDIRDAQRIGARGVPFFVVDGRFGISGAQPADVFSQALQQAWDSRPKLQTVGATTAQTGAADAAACGPDGCEIPHQPQR
ncbi:MAG TPA: DsbA family oxidoreductase [Myxococcaceae bacterium]|nr:DsbA family oxidoreductase [Myxococcaceae bacterium]